MSIEQKEYTKKTRQRLQRALVLHDEYAKKMLKELNLYALTRKEIQTWIDELD
jgi:hypothetical protein